MISQLVPGLATTSTTSRRLGAADEELGDAAVRSHLFELRYQRRDRRDRHGRARVQQLRAVAVGVARLPIPANLGLGLTVKYVRIDLAPEDGCKSRRRRQRFGQLVGLRSRRVVSRRPTAHRWRGQQSGPRHHVHRQGTERSAAAHAARRHDVRLPHHRGGRAARWRRDRAIDGQLEPRPGLPCGRRVRVPAHLRAACRVLERQRRRREGPLRRFRVQLEPALVRVRQRAAGRIARPPHRFALSVRF